MLKRLLVIADKNIDSACNAERVVRSDIREACKNLIIEEGLLGKTTWQIRLERSSTDKSITLDAQKPSAILDVLDATCENFTSHSEIILDEVVLRGDDGNVYLFGSPAKVQAFVATHKLDVIMTDIDKRLGELKSMVHSLEQLKGMKK